LILLFFFEAAIEKTKRGKVQETIENVGGGRSRSQTRLYC
jgi:hypothetical protein